MTKTRRMRIAALILTLTIVLASAPAAFAKQATVNADNANLLRGTGTKFSSLLTLPKGAVVDVLDKSNPDWYKVSYDDTVGFVGSSFLDYDASVAASEAPAAQEKPPAAAIQAPMAQEKPPAATASDAPAPEASGSKDPNKNKIASAKAKNKDTVGWISVPNTNIDYPILYGRDFYYANRNINKKNSLEGVYPYYGYLTKNVVLFGHNLRKSRTGFHEMHHMQETALGKSKCQSSACGRSLGSKHKDWIEDNRVWNISIYGKTKWEVFAMYEVKANEPKSTLRNNWSSLYASSDAAVQQWLDKQLKRSEISFGVSVSPRDTLMTIITCGTNYDSATANSRLFVFLKCVD